MIFLSGEVGLGGGLIVGGRPLTGVAGYGGEVGHIPVNPLAGATCRCGSVGCWETEVGEGALLVRAGRPADGGSAAVEAILADAAAGDATALAAARRGRALAGHRARRARQHAQPGRVVLGGRFAQLHPFIAATVEEALDRRALAAPRALVEIVPATLGVDAPLLGAAELAFEPILPDPAAGRDLWSPTKRGYNYHEQVVADPTRVRHAIGGGDSHARSSIGGAHHERRLGPGRLRRRR